MARDRYRSSPVGSRPGRRTVVGVSATMILKRPRASTMGMGVFRRWWKAGAEALAALALPRDCPCCDGDGEREVGAPFCGACWARLRAEAGSACPRCAAMVGPWGVRQEGCGECWNRTLGFDAAVALGPYEGMVRELCLLLKHRPGGWVAPGLAEALVEIRPQLREEAERAPGAWVVPIPLHWQRRLRRGYNQTEPLADGLAARLRLRRADSLKRVKPSPILAGRGRVERAKLTRGAFLAKERSSELKGKTVLLVDDVLTTGATCGAAARALKKAGAERVVAVVIGRAGARF